MPIIALDGMVPALRPDALMRSFVLGIRVSIFWKGNSRTGLVARITYEEGVRPGKQQTGCNIHIDTYDGPIYVNFAR